MTNKFYCVIPWSEVHINNDGTYQSCGSHKNNKSSTPFGSTHNVHNMTIKQWMSSQYQIEARIKKAANQPEPLCATCYQEDEVGKNSKRTRELGKYPTIPIEYYQPTVTSLPRSFHILLGNDCNLACKMCGPLYSSRIAAEQKRIGIWNGSVRQTWTDDQQAWNMLVDTMLRAENLEYVHLIGGEPLIMPRFFELIDALYNAGKTDIYIGFTTNGMVFNKDLMQKLQAFRHVDIGISLEGLGATNDFCRTGVNTELVKQNLEKYLTYRDPGHIYVVLRTVPSAITVHELDKLYLWAIERKLDVMSTFVANPTWLSIKQLPADVKQRLLQQYRSWEYGETALAGNDRNPVHYRQHIDNEITGIIKLLEQANDPEQTKILYSKLTEWGALEQEDIRNYFSTAEQHN